MVVLNEQPLFKNLCRITTPAVQIGRPDVAADEAEPIGKLNQT
jgi:hypothetical protein